MTTENKNNIFTLPAQELANPKFRKGYAGYLESPRSNADLEVHPPNYKPDLASYYRAGRYVGMRGGLTKALNALLPPRKKIEKKEEINESI